MLEVACDFDFCKIRIKLSTNLTAKGRNTKKNKLRNKTKKTQVNDLFGYDSDSNIMRDDDL